MAEEKPVSAGNKNDNTMATLAHALGIIIAFVGPLIIYLTQQKEGFVKEQAKEALNFQLTVLIAWVAAGVLSFVLVGMLLYPLIWVANLIFCIMGAMAANQGKAYVYPFRIIFIK